MRRIVIYGPGCAECTALAQVTEQVMRELCLEPLPEKVTDTAQLAAAGVLETPTLAVDGRILVSGTVPPRDEIRRMLQKALQADSPEKGCCSGRPEDLKTVKGNVPHPEAGACGCGGGGRCGSVSFKRKGGWKRAAVWAAALLILLAVVKMVNHRERSGGGEPPRPAVSAER